MLILRTAVSAGCQSHACMTHALMSLYMQHRLLVCLLLLCSGAHPPNSSVVCLCCLQTTASLCLPAQLRGYLQPSGRLLVAYCLRWRRRAASGTGQHIALYVQVEQGPVLCFARLLCLDAATQPCNHSNCTSLLPALFCNWPCCCLPHHCRRTSWRCFLAAVCATFTLSQLSRNAQHGMIGFTGVHTYENRDWLTQLPFILINAGRLQVFPHPRQRS